MLLALDIGNTNITLGVFDLKADADRPAPSAVWRVATEAGRMPDEYGLMLSQLLPLRGVSPSDLAAVAICSVVPPLTPVFVDLSRVYFGIDPVVVGAGVKTGVRVLYDNPRDLGADRIADAAAALRLNLE